jgi:hypothetical protein
MLKWCEGCLRMDNEHCEAFKEPYENCFAKTTDKEQYIKGQKEIIKYNGSYGAGRSMAYKSIKRVKGMIE